MMMPNPHVYTSHERETLFNWPYWQDCHDTSSKRVRPKRTSFQDLFSVDLPFTQGYYHLVAIRASHH